MATTKKNLTKKAWKEFTENERKIVLRECFPHMMGYYNQFKDTTDEVLTSFAWDLVRKYTKVDKDKSVWIRGVHPCSLYAC